VLAQLLTAAAWWGTLEALQQLVSKTKLSLYF
jgi:hypothetical protein